MKNKIKRSISLILSLILVFSLAACGKKEESGNESNNNVKPAQPTYTDLPGSVTKSETVYVNLDNSGKVKEVSVTDWLHTDKAEVMVKDKSDLKDIENVKSDTEPVFDKSSLTWHMGETDLYYSGSTDRQVPVSFDIQYELDGKKITAEKLKGKSGKVKIDVKMTNNCYREITVAGKKEKIYLPVLAVGGCIMPESSFSSIKVENGRAIGDGTKEIIAFFGLPGMSQSLGLDKMGLSDIAGLSVGSTASVTADVKNFAMENMYFALVPICSLQLDLNDKETGLDLESLFSVVGSLESAIASLDSGKVMELVSSADGIIKLVSSLGDAVELYNSNRALLALLSKYNESEYKDQIQGLLELLTDKNSIKAINALSDSNVITFLKKLSGFSKTFPVLDGLLKDLQNPEVQKAVDALPQTLEKLSTLQSTLNKNSALIDSLATFLQGDGAKIINEIVSVIGEVNFDKLEEKYAPLATNSDALVLKFNKWIDYGKSYRLFTQATDEMETSVLFVYTTPAI